MKKSIPDPNAVATALAGRLEQVEIRLTALEDVRQDVAALGRGLADVVAQVRALSDHTSRRIVAMPNQRTGNGTDPSGDGASVDDESDGQPNWLTVTDAAAATQWLVDAVAFADDVLRPLGSAPPSACWLLHPVVVVEVIALQAQYRVAYTSENATEVSEVLSRWLPGAAGRIGKALSSCQSERAHRVDGRLFEIPHLDPVRVAAWWIESRGTAPDAVEAFAMTPIR